MAAQDPIRRISRKVGPHGSWVLHLCKLEYAYQTDDS